MWIDKLTDGVLCVMTPMGARYIKPTTRERLYLMWVFRHFKSIPPQILTVQQRQFIDALYATQRFVPKPRLTLAGESLIIGTVETRPRMAVGEQPLTQPTASLFDRLLRLAIGVRQGL